MKNIAPKSPSRFAYRTGLTLASLVGGLLVSGPAHAQQAPASFTVLETGEGFGYLQQAVDAIGSGKATIAIAPGTYQQCSVQTQGDIAYLATEPGTAIFDGTTCEGKAALVFRGRNAEVAGLTFQNMHVPDQNGAGIRLEQGNLVVAQSWFKDSEQGILTGADEAGTLIVDRSTFTRLGTCEGVGGCAHSIYTGTLAQVRITRSRFEQGRGGHYLKSRAPRVDVASSSFDDVGGQGTNYMIDLPAGATGQISNNWFVQGRDKENYSAFIAVTAEGKWHSSDGLTIIGNDASFASGVDRNSTFVADWSGDALDIGGNALGNGLQRFERR